MTAINPARLKIQCGELGEFFLNPPQFISGFHDLLAFYGARIRQTRLSQTPSTLHFYQVPAPVLRALELELRDLVDEQPDKGIILIDALWKEDWLEFRQLGTCLLGYLPTSKPDLILDRIQNWLDQAGSDDLKRQIMTRALTRLADEKPAHVLNYLKSLVGKNTPADRQAVLFGLVPFAEDSDFDNLPVLFNILRDILLIDETGYIKEISTLIHLLQKKSEHETAYFLIRQMATASKPRIFRIVRKVMPFFAEESRQLLREKLKNYT